MSQLSSKESKVEELVAAVEERAITCPIPIRWRANQSMVGGGERNSRSKGLHGTDFYGLKPYEFGDDVRKIDWAATAKSGGQEIFVKQFYEPRDVKVWILIDSKLTMDFGTVRTTKRMLAAELACSIIKSVKKTNDLVGFITYDEKGIQAITPKAKPASVVKLQCLRAIIEPGVRHLFPGEKSENVAVNTNGADSTASGLATALEYVRTKPRALVFVISDFLDLNDNDKEEIGLTAGRHATVAMYVQDRRERELPNTWGIIPMEDIRTGQRKSVWLPPKWWPFQGKGMGVRDQYAQNFQNTRTAAIDFFRDNGILWEEFSTEEGAAAEPKIRKLLSGH
ncbi:MAG: DUF58 domain-containing protein [Candidatus Obscuribacterales bacterium]|jgi:uncharacterized protein (DUF58 family)